MMSSEEVLLLEHRRRAALVTIDRQALEDLLSDDLVFIHTNGMLEGKASLLASLGVAVRFLKIQAIEESLLVRAQMAVVCAGLEVTVQVPTEPAPFTLRTRILSVWAPEQSGWRQQAYQATRVA